MGRKLTRVHAKKRKKTQRTRVRRRALASSSTSRARISACCFLITKRCAFSNIIRSRSSFFTCISSLFFRSCSAAYFFRNSAICLSYSRLYNAKDRPTTVPLPFLKTLLLLLLLPIFFSFSFSTSISIPSSMPPTLSARSPAKLAATLPLLLVLLSPDTAEPEDDSNTPSLSSLDPNPAIPRPPLKSTWGLNTRENAMAFPHTPAPPSSASPPLSLSLSFSRSLGLAPC